MKAKKGDAVKVHYTGTLTDGTVFDSSEGKEPLAFVLGQGQIIPGFENGVEGMEVGAKKTINIASKDAYGDLVKEAIIEIPVGQKLVLLNPQTGEPMPVTIMAAEDGKLTLDGNHPLAGKALTFELTLESVGDAKDLKDECCGGHGDAEGGCGCKH